MSVVVAAAPGAAPPRREWAVFATRLARRRTALFGLVVVAVVILTSLAAPWLTPFDPIEQDIGERLRAPGARDAAGRLHPLGTDHLGRDLLARVIYGAQPALLVGFAAVVISGLLGLAAGLLGGYFGGWIDDVLMRLADIQLAFPFILLAIAVIGVLGASLTTIIIVIESALSFLGLGVQPPTPTWGGMLADGRVYISTAWWLATFPGLAILVSVLGINLFGDGLRDTLDPRLKV